MTPIVTRGVMNVPMHIRNGTTFLRQNSYFLPKCYFFRHLNWGITFYHNFYAIFYTNFWIFYTKFFTPILYTNSLHQFFTPILAFLHQFWLFYTNFGFFTPIFYTNFTLNFVQKMFSKFKIWCKFLM